MNIVRYDAKYKNTFIQFNTDWIIDHFGKLEKEDFDTFEKIEEELEAGAMIYFALEDDVVLATCMVKPMEGTTWELCKLASNKHREHKGCGSAVFEAAMQWAIEHGAKRLFIISNSKLKPALHIYEKYGFEEIEIENYGYERGDIAFERRID
ncbi:MAG: GNAT family N-acetyltransferase [Allobaculum sp.]|nr:GNAT family N-acetyltransferase [Allobaculum sp.]MDE5758800.1 GNAT family N-acetyltransferase [Allobaculum sp.]